MKVGIFVDSYKPIITGVVNTVDLMRRGLETLGHEVHIFAPGSPGYRDTEDRVYRFHSINLSTRVAAPLAIPVSPSVLGLIPRLGLDIIHTQHPFAVGQLGVYMARRLGLPTVYTFHTQYEQYAHYVPLNQHLVKTLARWVVVSHAERCDTIICPAPSISKLLRSYGIQRPIEILPNAVDLSAFDRVPPGDVRARLGIGPHERVAIYCGRLAREKNLPFMLHALRGVLQEVPDRRLVLVGEGTERDDLMGLARRLGLEDRVLFPGRIEYTDVPRYYAAADLFVMTSVTEVRPLALIEAMASGLPVVAVSAPGSTDTVTHGVDGLLTPDDPAAFADAVRHLLSDDGTRTEMGPRARGTAGTYSIIDTTRRLVGIYEQARESRLAARA